MQSVNDNRRVSARDYLLSALLGCIVGFSVFSIFGSAQELATLTYNFKYRFHVPMLSLQVSTADQTWAQAKAESLTEDARCLSVAKSMLEHGFNGGLAGSSVGLALLASLKRKRKTNESAIKSLGIPIIFALILTMLLSAGLFFYWFKSDSVVMIMSAQLLCEWLIFFISAFPPLVLVAALVAVIGKCLPGKLEPGHRLAAVPWIMTLVIVVWGFYWGYNPPPQGMERPASESWVAIPILLAFPVSLTAWILLVCRGGGKRARLILVGTSHLVFQLPVAFISLMMAMNVCL